MPDLHYEEEEFSTQFSGKTLIRIISLLKSHWKWAAGFILLIGLVSVQDSFFTYIGKLIIDQGIMARDSLRLTQLIGLYGALAAVQVFAVFGFIYLAGILGERVQYDLRKEMFNHLQDLSFSYFDRTPVGWIMSRVTSDSGKISELVTWGLIDLTWSSLNIVTAVIFMLIINWKLALVVLAIIPLMILTAVQFQKRILFQFRGVRRLNSKITAAYNENITGVRIVKALCREEQNLNEFSQKSHELYWASYRAAWLSALFLPCTQIIGSLALGAIIWYGGLQNLSGGMTLGGIQAFISYVAFMLWPIQEMARVWASMQSSLASAERVFSLIDSVPEIRDQESAYDPGTIRSAISFEHVDFYYEQGKPVLKDFNLCIRQGESIALVGPTGGGKSTIINLICRFYEPSSGEIYFDGVDYRRLTLHSIQSRIGIVLQTPHLFSGSIGENIRYGRLDATPEEIEEAARLSKALDFIMNLEKGYEEEVGEGGNLLSVGQKQLISLARAVLSEPDIFIMDEATSSIDTLTESLIQQGLKAVMAGRTSIIIAHRLSTIKQVDRILVVEDGRIVEEGDHLSLIKAKGRYYSLYTQQFRREHTRDWDRSMD